MGVLVAIVVILAVLWLLSWVVGTIFGLLIAAVFWGIAGYLASRIMGGEGESVLSLVLLGLIGGILGSLILRALNLQGIENIWLIGNIISGVIGAVVLIAVVRLLGNKQFAR